MKKKLLSILLSLAMVVTMMPAMTMTAFAADKTIAEILQTVNFPQSSSYGEVPTTAWICGENKCYLVSNNLYFKSSGMPLLRDVSNPTTEQGNDYVEATLYSTITFKMNGDGNLSSIELNGGDYYPLLSGTYFPPTPASNWSLLAKAVSGEAQATVDDVFAVSDNEQTGVRTITLLSNITATSTDREMTVEATGDGGKEIILDLNGHVLDAAGKNAEHRRAFVVEGKLTIKDSSDTEQNGTGTGQITKGFEGSDGGAINIESGGELVIESGAICNNKSSDTRMDGSGGGAIHCEGKLTIKGGAIHHNKACWGGAFGFNKGTEFLMTGGRIYENESLVMDGAAINMYKKGGDITSAIIGGEIYGNISNRTTGGASSDATVGGVVSAGNAVWVEGTLYLGGNAKIYGNKQGDYVGGSWTNLENTANLAMVSDSDSGKRGTIKVSGEHPFTTGANICLSQTSEHVKVVPLEEDADLTGFGITTGNGFTAENCKYFHVDSLNDNDGYDITCKNNIFYTKAMSTPIPTPVPTPTDEQKFTNYKTAETSKLEKLAEEVTSDSDKAIVATAKADLEALKYDSTKTLAENKASARSIVEAAFVHVDKVVQNKLKAYKNGKIKVSWKALTLKDNWTVDSYQVYRKVRGGKYKRVATVKLGKKKTITYTNTKKLKKGKKYYYKVRGKNLLSDGTYAYTKWSKVKSIKCKKTRK